MADYNPLPPNQKGERHRASIQQKVIEVSQKLDEDQETIADNINFLLDIGQRRSQSIISYYQVLNYMEKDNQNDETLFKFRAITGHQGTLDNDDPNYKGSFFNDGRQGRQQRNHCLSELQMIQLPVQHMQRNIVC